MTTGRINQVTIVSSQHTHVAVWVLLEDLRGGRARMQSRPQIWGDVY